MGGKMKVRRLGLFKGGGQFGASGSSFSTLAYGTVSACVPAMNASGLGAGSMAIPEAETTSILFFSGSLTNGVLIYAASVNSAANVTASYMADDATIASTLTFRYLCFTP